MTRDLQNPLSEAAMTAALIIDRDARQLPQQAQKDLGRVARLLGRANDATHVLIEAFEVLWENEEWQQVDLVRCVERAIEDLPRGRRDAEVSIEPLPSVWAQSQKLQHAFSSLLTSATRHLPERDGAIHIDAVTGGPVTIVRMQDNGSGIPPEDLDGMFEPFGRTSGHRRDRLNAGLAIARRVVLGHGGRLWATSDVGAGTCFNVQLPCVVQFPVEGETTTTLSLSY